MGDEFSNTGNGNWWKASTSASSSSCSSSGLGCGTIGGFGWAPAEAIDIKERSSSIESGGSVVFHDKLHDSSARDHHQQQQQQHLQMIGLGLSSQPVDQWNQSLLRGDNKAETSFVVMPRENLNANSNISTSSYQQESGSSSQASLWRDSPVTDFKMQMNSRSGFFLDQAAQFSPHGSSSDSSVTCQSFAVDNSSNNLYPSSGMFQGTLLGSDQPRNQSSMSYSQFGSAPGNFTLSNDQMAATSAWFSRASPPSKPHSPLRFSNNAPFWNPSAPATANAAGSHDVSSNFFPVLQPPQIHTPSFNEKPKSIPELRDLSSAARKRSGGDQPEAKRTKNETATSNSPAVKVRKEKMGDRIAALQQLVSPFGKTDAASVLSEAIEYIKFLHQQVTALSNPYIKSGASLQHQQNCDQTRDFETLEQDLRSRGLCLVPISSTFPVTHDTTVDFWTPTFGGSFR